jgi:hypothetical protein
MSRENITLNFFRLKKMSILERCINVKRNIIWQIMKTKVACIFNLLAFEKSKFIQACNPLVKPHDLQAVPNRILC